MDQLEAIVAKTGLLSSAIAVVYLFTTRKPLELLTNGYLRSVTGVLVSEIVYISMSSFKKYDSLETSTFNCYLLAYAFFSFISWTFSTGVLTFLEVYSRPEYFADISKKLLKGVIIAPIFIVIFQGKILARTKFSNLEFWAFGVYEEENLELAFMRYGLILLVFMLNSFSLVLHFSNWMQSILLKNREQKMAVPKQLALPFVINYSLLPSIKNIFHLLGGQKINEITNSFEMVSLSWLGIGIVAAVMYYFPTDQKPHNEKKSHVLPPKVDNSSPSQNTPVETPEHIRDDLINFSHKKKDQTKNDILEFKPKAKEQDSAIEVSATRYNRYEPRNANESSYPLSQHKKSNSSESKLIPTPSHLSNINQPSNSLSQVEHLRSPSKEYENPNRFRSYSGTEMAKRPISTLITATTHVTKPGPEYKEITSGSDSESYHHSRQYSPENKMSEVRVGQGEKKLMSPPIRDNEAHKMNSRPESVNAKSPSNERSYAQGTSISLHKEHKFPTILSERENPDRLKSNYSVPASTKRNSENPRVKTISNQPLQDIKIPSEPQRYFRAEPVKPEDGEVRVTKGGTSEERIYSPPEKDVQDVKNSRMDPKNSKLIPNNISDFKETDKHTQKANLLPIPPANQGYSGPAAERHPLNRPSDNPINYDDSIQNRKDKKITSKFKEFTRDKPYSPENKVFAGIDERADKKRVSSSPEDDARKLKNRTKLENTLAVSNDIPHDSKEAQSSSVEHKSWQVSKNEKFDHSRSDFEPDDSRRLVGASDNRAIHISNSHQSSGYNKTIISEAGGYYQNRPYYPINNLSGEPNERVEKERISHPHRDSFANKLIYKPTPSAKPLSSIDLPSNEISSLVREKSSPTRKENSYHFRSSSGLNDTRPATTTSSDQTSSIKGNKLIKSGSDIVSITEPFGYTQGRFLNSQKQTSEGYKEQAEKEVGSRLPDIKAQFWNDKSKQNQKKKENLFADAMDSSEEPLASSETEQKLSSTSTNHEKIAHFRSSSGPEAVRRLMNPSNEKTIHASDSHQIISDKKILGAETDEVELKRGPRDWLYTSNKHMPYITKEEAEDEERIVHPEDEGQRLKNRIESSTLASNDLPYHEGPQTRLKSSPLTNSDNSKKLMIHSGPEFAGYTSNEIPVYGTKSRQSPSDKKIVGTKSGTESYRANREFNTSNERNEGVKEEVKLSSSPPLENEVKRLNSKLSSPDSRMVPTGFNGTPLEPLNQRVENKKITCESESGRYSEDNPNYSENQISGMAKERPEKKALQSLHHEKESHGSKEKVKPLTAITLGMPSHGETPASSNQNVKEKIIASELESGPAKYVQDESYASQNKIFASATFETKKNASGTISFPQGNETQILNGKSNSKPDLYNPSRHDESHARAEAENDLALPSEKPEKPRHFKSFSGPEVATRIIPTSNQKAFHVHNIPSQTPEDKSISLGCDSVESLRGRPDDHSIEIAQRAAERISKAEITTSTQKNEVQRSNERMESLSTKSATSNLPNNVELSAPNQAAERPVLSSNKQNFGNLKGYFESEIAKGTIDSSNNKTSHVPNSNQIPKGKSVELKSDSREDFQSRLHNLQNKIARIGKEATTAIPQNEGLRLNSGLNFSSGEPVLKEVPSIQQTLSQNTYHSSASKTYEKADHSKSITDPQLERQFIESPNNKAIDIPLSSQSLQNNKIRSYLDNAGDSQEKPHNLETNITGPTKGTTQKETKPSFQDKIVENQKKRLKPSSLTIDSNDGPQYEESQEQPRIGHTRPSSMDPSHLATYLGSEVAKPKMNFSSNDKTADVLDSNQIPKKKNISVDSVEEFHDDPFNMKGQKAAGTKNRAEKEQASFIPQEDEPHKLDNCSKLPNTQSRPNKLSNYEETRALSQANQKPPLPSQKYEESNLFKTESGSDVGRHPTTISNKKTIYTSDLNRAFGYDKEVTPGTEFESVGYPHDRSSNSENNRGVSVNNRRAEKDRISSYQENKAQELINSVSSPNSKLATNNFYPNERSLEISQKGHESSSPPTSNAEKLEQAQIVSRSEVALFPDGVSNDNNAIQDSDPNQNPEDKKIVSGSVEYYYGKHSGSRNPQDEPTKKISEKQGNSSSQEHIRQMLSSNIKPSGKKSDSVDISHNSQDVRSKYEFSNDPQEQAAPEIYSPGGHLRQRSLPEGTRHTKSLLKFNYSSLVPEGTFCNRFSKPESPKKNGLFEFNESYGNPRHFTVAGDGDLENENFIVGKPPIHHKRNISAHESSTSKRTLSNILGSLGSIPAQNRGEFPSKPSSEVLSKLPKHRSNQLSLDTSKESLSEQIFKNWPKPSSKSSMSNLSKLQTAQVSQAESPNASIHHTAPIGIDSRPPKHQLSSGEKWFSPKDRHNSFKIQDFLNYQIKRTQTQDKGSNTDNYVFTDSSQYESPKYQHYDRARLPNYYMSSPENYQHKQPQGNLDQSSSGNLNRISYGDPKFNPYFSPSHFPRNPMMASQDYSDKATQSYQQTWMGPHISTSKNESDFSNTPIEEDSHNPRFYFRSPVSNLARITKNATTALTLTTDKTSISTQTEDLELLEENSQRKSHKKHSQIKRHAEEMTETRLDSQQEDRETQTEIQDTIPEYPEGFTLSSKPEEHDKTEPLDSNTGISPVNRVSLGSNNPDSFPIIPSSHNQNMLAAPLSKRDKETMTVERSDKETMTEADSPLLAFGVENRGLASNPQNSAKSPAKKRLELDLKLPNFEKVLEQRQKGFDEEDRRKNLIWMSKPSSTTTNASSKAVYSFSPSKAKEKASNPKEMKRMNTFNLKLLKNPNTSISESKNPILGEKTQNEMQDQINEIDNENTVGSKEDPISNDKSSLEPKNEESEEAQEETKEAQEFPAQISIPLDKVSEFQNPYSHQRLFMSRSTAVSPADSTAARRFQKDKTQFGDFGQVDTRNDPRQNLPADYRDQLQYGFMTPQANKPFYPLLYHAGNQDIEDFSDAVGINPHGKIGKSSNQKLGPLLQQIKEQKKSLQNSRKQSPYQTILEEPGQHVETIEEGTGGESDSQPTKNEVLDETDRRVTTPDEVINTSEAYERNNNALSFISKSYGPEMTDRERTFKVFEPLIGKILRAFDEHADRIQLDNPESKREQTLESEDRSAVIASFTPYLEELIKKLLLQGDTERLGSDRRGSLSLEAAQSFFMANPGQLSNFVPFVKDVLVDHVKQRRKNSVFNTERKKTEEKKKRKLYYQLNIPEDFRITELKKKVCEVKNKVKEQGLKECELILGIDCTSSNILTGKKSFGKRPLHEISQHRLNFYEQVIGILGSIVDDLSPNGIFPVYLFGDGLTKERKVRPLFVDTEGDENCYGIKHALSEYRRQIPKVELSGPTSFKPLIEKAIKIIEKNWRFHLLIIIGDGAVTEVKVTQEAIIRASNYPMSIIMVGVGDGDAKKYPKDPWYGMKQFQNELPNRKFKNFTFVQFSKGMEPEEFAEYALAEVPTAYNYCKKNGIL